MTETCHRILLVIPQFERHFGDLLVTVDRRFAAPITIDVGMATTTTTTTASTVSTVLTSC
jgi:hypothetical protein